MIKQLSAVFDMIDTHVVITDQNANILYMNKTAEEKTGYLEKEALGKNPGDLWGGQSENAVYANLWKTIKVNKKSFVTNVKNRRKDGTEIYQQLQITPLLDSKGDIQCFIAIEPDITHDHRSETELQTQISIFFQSKIDQELQLEEFKRDIVSLQKG